MSSRPCKFFAQGRCTYGDRCKFSHSSTSTVPRHQAPNATQPSRPEPNRPRLKRGEKPCRAWSDGECPKGDKCFFAHDPQVREERLRREQAEARRQQIELERQAIQQEASRRARLEQEAFQRARQAQLDAHRAETVRREAAHTIQQIVLDTSLVTYAAGVAILDVITGFDSCRIRIKGLPTDATTEEILALFTQQGVERRRLFMVGQRPVDGRLEATLITTAEEGSVIAIGLEDIEFGQERLHFEVSENANGMGTSAPKDCDTLSLMWRAPSSAVIATFATEEIARAKVQSLNRQLCGNRRVRVEMNQPPPGHVRMFLDVQRSVKITGLPLDISYDVVAEFAGCESLRFLKPIFYDAVDGLRQVEQQARDFAGRDLISLDAPSPHGDIEGNITVKCRFTSWEAAKRTEELFTGKQLVCLGNRFIRSRLPNPHQYILSIPAQQYKSQRRLWDSLVDPDAPNKKLVSIRIFSAPNNGRVQIRVVGEDKQAVGSLKVRVENLAGGEALPRDLWHRSLKCAAGTQFLNSLFNTAGAYARADWKMCVVKLFGDPAAIERAREIVKGEVERLNAFEFSVYLKKESVRFFVHSGITALKDALGEENATLMISRGSSKILVRGGEDARQIVDRLVAESLEEMPKRNTDTANCPVCYDEISLPVLLGCDHTYCMRCLQHYISAADSFPLNCLGNDATCDVPIPLPTIQRFLPPAQFQQLLETAYLRYVEQHTDQFKYCKTPDCTQVYRRQAARTTVTCPSCFRRVCPACDEEAHEGMTCEEQRLHNNPGEQERLNDLWAAQNGVKRCPACSVMIQRTEGCNHMACRCGAHLCWLCVRQFENGPETYEHLRNVHGGAFDVPAEVAPPPVLNFRWHDPEMGFVRPAVNERGEAERRARELQARAVAREADPQLALLRENRAQREADREERERRRQQFAENERLLQERQRLDEEARRTRENRGFCILM
ncbi:hypothetical protein C8F01DRAFT_1055945 [Mycena amicta]|nr:hypothetical protein C8F01DRAFT_1055945 [Mycena amicta]